jgi:hypothetical protein
MAVCLLYGGAVPEPVSIKSDNVFFHGILSVLMFFASFEAR